jgi:hypothetical protein
MSESGKNASGKEAFGSKIVETPVVESPAALVADVTSTAGRVGMTVALEADKVRTSTALATEDEGCDLCTAGLLPTPGPQAAEAGGARVEDDLHRCLYVGTPWEVEVVADRRDVEEFKEACCTIGCVLSVRVFGRAL